MMYSNGCLTDAEIKGGRRCQQDDRYSFFSIILTLCEMLIVNA
jgi:hypothetical protein